ncbi:MAG TPA: hypothetical protein VF578_16280 [Methylomirabilota bacterium]
MGRRLAIWGAATCLVAVLSLVAWLGAEGEPDALDQLKPGEWYEVPNSKLRAVLPSPPSMGAPTSIMSAWTGGVWDPVREALILPANGGHGDYGGNEVYAFSLSSLSWQRLTDPSPVHPPNRTIEALPDGRPASRHTYGGVSFLPTGDKVFVTGGSLWGDGGGSRGAWTFDVPSRTWERRADAPGSQVTAMTAYDPVTKLVFSLLQSGRLVAYDPAKNSWSERGSAGTWAEYDPARTMVLHPGRRTLLVVGGGETTRFDISRSYASVQPLSTSGGDPIVNAQGPGLVYDPVTDRIVGWAGGGDVYSLDLASRTWTRHAPTGSAVPGPAPHQGTYGKWQYIPSKNAFIAATRIDENVWLYRLSEGRRSVVEPGLARWALAYVFPRAAAVAHAAESGTTTGTAPAPGAKLDLPLRTWVSRPLPTGTSGPGPVPDGSKHTRLLYDSRRGRMVLTGGDYVNAYISSNGSQMVWAIDLASGSAPTWTLIGPWCNGPVQPGRPDTVGWVYDSKRDQGVLVPGYVFANERASSGCAGVVDSKDSMLFDFSTNKWKVAPYGPPPHGWGGDIGSSFAVYDRVTDSVIRFRWGGRTLVETLSLEKNKWSVFDPGDGNDPNRDQPAIDVQGRSVYLLSRRLGALLRYSIAKESIVDMIPVPREARLPKEADFETHLTFDPVNRVVLYPNTLDFGGRVRGLGIYHVDTKKWEWEPTPGSGHPVQGNVVGFDAGNNVMMLYGGKQGEDIDPPTVFWLYRYGNGTPGTSSQR